MIQLSAFQQGVSCRQDILNLNQELTVKHIQSILIGEGFFVFLSLLKCFLRWFTK